MTVLITGASGYIGRLLALKIAGSGSRVHVLLHRTGAEEFRSQPNIMVFHGDILDMESVKAAMEGCEEVYHLAATTGVWNENPMSFREINYEGTRIVLEAALQAGVRRFLYTGSCGILLPVPGKLIDESNLPKTEFETDYYLSKKMGEDLVLDYMKKGMNAVIVYPAKIYGPGKVSHSLTTNEIIRSFLKRRITIIPSPGSYKICLAYIDDVVNGIIMAMEKGCSGEKYLLGGVNISYEDFFRLTGKLSKKFVLIIPLPRAIFRLFARIQEVLHGLTGRPIRFTQRSVNQLFADFACSSEKAERELSYFITPIEEGMKKTIESLDFH